MEGKEYQDPDYPVTVKLEPSASSSNNDDRLERARTIIQREIQAELNAREIELSAVDERMWQARRVLHRLRCVLIQNQYSTSRPLDSREMFPCTESTVISRNMQTRLHPSHRRLTNTDAVSEEQLFFSLQNSRENDVKCENSNNSKPHTETNVRIDKNNVPENCRESTFKKMKKIPRHIEPDTSNKIVTLDQSVRARQKHKYRIIIGNTSKYSPGASLSDRCSHKWMLYVRTPQAGGDIILRAVTVRLHESYAPHHVCHLKSAPFQVSRRGWGEFPARVELHFALPQLNRPAVVEHVITLDKRRTGLHSLGSETIVDVWLYSNEEMLEYAMKDDTSKENTEKSQENVDNWNEFFSTDSTQLDIDEMIIKPVKNTKAVESADMSIKEEPIDYDFDLNGMEMSEAPFEDDSWFESIAGVKDVTSVSRNVNQNGMNKYLHILNDHCYVSSKESFKAEIERSTDKLRNGKKHRFDLAEVVSNINCIRSAVNFLLGKIPLVSDNAESYKTMFPFMVKDEQTYCSLSDVRRRNLEWSRAKIINEILKKNFKNKPAIWRTKQILYFSRLHGYHQRRQNAKPQSEHETQWELHVNLKQMFPTSLDINSGSIFDSSRLKSSHYECVNEPVVLSCDSDDELDVTGVAVSTSAESMSPVKRKLEVIPLENDDERLRCYFIEKVCSDIGIELRNEDIGYGFSHSAVHRVILTAMRCLVSDILRSALAETSLQQGTPPLWSIEAEGSIGLQHIFQALRRTERFSLFTSESLYASPTDYSEKL